MQSSGLATSLILSTRNLDSLIKNGLTQSYILLMLKPRQELRAPDSKPSAHFIDSLPGFEKKSGGQFMLGKCPMMKGSKEIRRNVIRAERSRGWTSRSL